MILNPINRSWCRWAILGLVLSLTVLAAYAAPDPRAIDVPPAISPPPATGPGAVVLPPATQPASAEIACMLGVQGGWLIAQGHHQNGQGSLAWGPVRIVRMGPESAVTFRDAGTRMIVALSGRRYVIDVATGQLTTGLVEPGDVPGPLLVDPRLLEAANEKLQLAEQQLTASLGKLRELMVARALGEASEADLRAAQQQYAQDQTALEQAQLEMARLVAGPSSPPWSNGQPATQPRNHVPPIIIPPRPLEEPAPTAPAPILNPLEQAEFEVRRLSVEVQAADNALAEARQRQRAGQGTAEEVERAAQQYDRLSEQLLTVRARLEQLRRPTGTTPP